MEEEGHGDLRVPIISGVFFVSSITGGILLIMWLSDVNGSQPWFPILALILISFPWVFWFFTYIYTFIKPCFRRDNGRGVNRDVSRRPPTASAKRASSSVRDSPVNSPTGKRQVQFGAVVVMDEGGGGSSRDGHHDGGAGDDKLLLDEPAGDHSFQAKGRGSPLRRLCPVIGGGLQSLVPHGSLDLSCSGLSMRSDSKPTLSIVVSIPTKPTTPRSSGRSCRMATNPPYRVEASEKGVEIGLGF
ncbi:hypothetical protein RHSIM_Rhsim07G0046200 [Rhododendron simsii]|uniref:Uncharacterized protein n=1 Tax=Rhododendron simsii TaxID=118357 RepID=A0A834GUV1_RHOSS|nr:hypothetical protein RHSIM_Rhsim07G0046200 [Rhododendron simsii]